MADFTPSKINGSFKNKDILSLDQFTPTDLEILFKETSKMKEIAIAAKPSDIMAGKLVTLLFYDPSCRNFGSFAAAINQLRGQTVAIQDQQHF